MEISNCSTTRPIDREKTDNPSKWLSHKRAGKYRADTAKKST